MDAKRFVTGSVVGGIVLYAVGYLIWDLAFADFFRANAGSATGVPRDTQVIWAVALGNLAYGTLVTWVMLSRGGTTAIGAGLRIGATVGFLMWVGVDFIFYGLMNLSNLAATMTDPLLEIVHGGLAGAAIAAVAGKAAK